MVVGRRAALLVEAVVGPLVRPDPRVRTDTGDEQVRTVHKFPFRITGEPQFIDVTCDWRPVLVEMQDDTPCLWAEVFTSSGRQRLQLLVTGTGHPVPTTMGHVGSFQQPPFVWHLWARP